MDRYKYKALNAQGRPIRGSIAALNETDLYNQLQSANLELIDCSIVGEKSQGFLPSSFMQKPIVIRDLIQFFVQMQQMQTAGVPILDALNDVRDTSDNPRMRDIVSDIHRDVSDGLALSEAMQKHEKVFKPLYVSLIQAGEETGDLEASYAQLIKYLKWLDQIESKFKKATRYPMIVTGVVMLTITFMMMLVVPQIVGFLQFLDLELPWFTVALIATSDFFAQPVFEPLGIAIYGGFLVVGIPVLLVIALKLLRQSSEAFSFQYDAIMLEMPVFGVLIRKISVARYAQTFGALFSSGIDVLGALKASRNTVTNLAMIAAMETVETHVKAGNPLSESFNMSGEFPTMVTRMVKIGEESGNLTVVLDQVSEFYTKDVDETIDSLIELIQPTLTAILGLVIAWIAAGSLGPIYMNLGQFMDF